MEIEIHHCEIAVSGISHANDEVVQVVPLYFRRSVVRTHAIENLYRKYSKRGSCQDEENEEYRPRAHSYPTMSKIRNAVEGECNCPD